MHSGKGLQLLHQANIVISQVELLNTGRPGDVMVLAPIAYLGSHGEGIGGGANSPWGNNGDCRFTRTR